MEYCDHLMGNKIYIIEIAYPSLAVSVFFLCISESIPLYKFVCFGSLLLNSFVSPTRLTLPEFVCFSNSTYFAPTKGWASRQFLSSHIEITHHQSFPLHQFGGYTNSLSLLYTPLENLHQKFLSIHSTLQSRF